MTIKNGQPWGQLGSLPPAGVAIQSDGELRSVVQKCMRTDTPLPVFGLLNGDLWRAVGAPIGGLNRLRSEQAQTVTIDLVEVGMDEQTSWFCSHMFIRNRLWLGKTIAVMNSEWMGQWRVAPRAHPNDGKVDIVEGALPLGQRLIARKRIRTGDHIPHPRIKVSQKSAWSAKLDPLDNVYLDGQKVGRFKAIKLKVLPDALTVVF
ncbi:MAG: diacylglycerol kinase family enzyme [Candidatus Poriferisodalaceae bacterium]